MTKPMTEPMTCGHGPGPGFPLQLLALIPGGLRDHPLSTL